MKRASTPGETAQVGRAVPRLESWQKVTGRAEYVHNLRLPGMLYGKIFRSTVPHGRIRRIDASAARGVGGVYRVVTAADIRSIVPEPYYGPAFHDQPILAIDKVRYVGEPVAVVLASDPHVAEEAAHLIVAEYEELPAVYDEIEAMTSTAIVHDELKPAGTFPDLKHVKGRKGTNVALEYRLRRGDAAQALAAADRVFEHTFRTQQVMHTPLEPHVSVAESREGSLTIHTASQSPSFVRIELARLLGWPENRIRVRVPFLGGGFGAKLYIKLEALVAVLALLTRRPVKVSLTMEEQFFTITRHATTFRIRSGVSRDGRITARECEVWWNGGAYADIGPRVTQKSGFTAAGPYDIEHVAIDSRALYTNLPPAGALRGFGVPQLVWAYESHTDLIARELELDPLAFRRQNLLRDGRPQASGTPMQDAALGEVLDRLETLMDWGAPFERGAGPVRRGRGIAIGFKACVAPTTSVAMVTLNADGSVVVHCGTVDMGQGSDTAMAQIAGEVLRLPAESVTVVHSDTDATPYDMATLGSRSLFHMGNAVRLAAPRARGGGGPRARRRHADRRRVPQALRHAGGERDRHGELQPELHAARPRDRAHARRHAVLDGRWCRRGGGGGHGNRPRAHRQRGGRRHAGQPEDRRDADLRRVDHAARLHAVREDGLRRRPAPQRLARGVPDPGPARPAARAADRDGRRRAAHRSVRREGRRRERHARRGAGDRECDRGRGRCAADHSSASGRGRVSRAAGGAGRAAGGRLMAEMRTIRFRLNGEAVSAHIGAHENLVEVLAGQFGLGGARESCGQGLCGCCTVLVDARAVSGCLYLAAFADGAEVTTVEHAAPGERLDAVQEAFVEAGAFQCGFCTPGFVLMTRELLAEHPDPDEDEIRHYLSGNLCRCAAYPEIIEAVKLAARKRRMQARTPEER